MTEDIDRMIQNRMYENGVSCGKYRAVGEMFNALRTDDRMSDAAKWAVGEFLSRYLDKLDKEVRQ